MTDCYTRHCRGYCIHDSLMDEKLRMDRRRSHTMTMLGYRKKRSHTMTIVQAIADFEGYNIPTSRARRNNNPGNINFGILSEQFGGVLETIPEGIAEEARFASFPFAEAGWNCLRLLLNKNYCGMTVLDAFNKYAPPNENNTVSYAQFICKETGLALTDTLTNVNIG